MAWPTSQDYNEAIQNAATSFSDPDLKKGEVVLNSIGLPVPRSGNFADVYEFKTQDGKRWALKLFTRKVAGLQERYAKIDQHLSRAQFPFTVGFKYIVEGIRIRGEWYPVLKMEWVEGFTLNEFVRDNAGKPQYLHALMQMWGKLTALLRDADFAHADLQHGNVLLVPATNGRNVGLRLIDYDGMWVPALAETHSGEVGHPNFQHPWRLKDRLYNADVDRFPHLVVAAALRGTLIGGKPFWDKFDNGDNLLFKESDLRDPASSPVFKALWNLNDSVLCTIVGKMALATKEPLRRTPWLDDLLLTDDGKRLHDDEEAKVMQLLGVGPHFTAAKTASAPKLQQEFEAFAFEEDAPPPPTKSKDKSASHKALPAKEEKKGKKSSAKEEKKSKLPLFIGGGVAALLLLVGIIVAMSGSGNKETPSQPEVAKNDGKKPDITPKVIITKKDNTDDPIVDDTKKKKDTEIVVKKDPVIRTGEPQLVWKKPVKAGFNRLLFLNDGSQILRNPINSPSIALLDAANGTEITAFNHSLAKLETIRIGPGNLLITTGSKRLAAFDVKTKQERFSIDTSYSTVPCPVARDLNAVMVPKIGGEIEVYSLIDGKQIETHRLSDAQPTAHVRYLDCSADGKTIAAISAFGKLYIKTADSPNLKIIHQDSRVKEMNRRAALSPDSKYVALCLPEEPIKVFDTTTGKPKCLLTGHEQEVKHLLFTKDNRWLLSLSLDRTFRVWDVETGKQLHKIDLEGEGRALDLSPDGNLAVLSTENSDSVQLWRLPGASAVVAKKDPAGGVLAEPKELWKTEGPVNFNCLEFSSDGSQIFRSRALDPRNIFVHSAADGAQAPQPIGAPLGIATMLSGPDQLLSLKTMTNKTTNSKLIVFDLQTKMPRFTAEIEQQVLFCPFAADINAVLAPDAPGKIAVLSVVDGKKIQSYDVPETAVVRSIDCSPDGKVVVAFSADGELFAKTSGAAGFKSVFKIPDATPSNRKANLSPDFAFVAITYHGHIHVHETATGKVHRVLRGHSDEIKDVFFSPDGRYILSASKDKTFRAWDVEAGKQAHSIDLEAPAKAIAMSPDGRTVAIATEDNQLRAFRLTYSGGAPVAKNDPDPTLIKGPKPGEVIEVEIAPGAKMKLCWIPPGKATLGSPETEKDRGANEKEHEFTTKGFWLGKYEVTQQEWLAVMGGANPSRLVPSHTMMKKDGILDTSRFPVDFVSWENCQEFIKKLNEKAPTTKGRFALPDEDEWEYACRGGKGNQHPFYFGDELNGKQANSNGERPYGTTTTGPSLGRSSEAGSYEKIAPHPWGLCDMHGNVWEWCSNWFDDAMVDHAFRGGSYYQGSHECRSAKRFNSASRPYFNVGVRIAILPSDDLKKSDPIEAKVVQPPVPKAPFTNEELEKARLAALEVFGAQIDKAQVPATRKAVAQKIHALANDTKLSIVDRWAHYTIARNVFVLAGDLPSAVQTLEEQTRLFPPAQLELIGEAADKMAKIATGTNAKPLLELLDEGAEEASDHDDLKTAARLLAISVNVSRRNTKDEAASRRLEARWKNVADLSKAFEDAKTDEEKGRLYCFRKGDWPRGLPLIAKSSDADLAAAAMKDLTSPSEAADQLQVGDRWFDLAQKATGEEKAAYFRRAYWWYRTGIGAAAGDVKMKAEQRMKTALESGAIPDSEKATYRTAKVGGRGGNPFEDLPNPRARLVGFDVYDNGQIIRGIQPIYRDAAGKQFRGKFRGAKQGNWTVVDAKPGFAMVGMTIRGGNRVDGLQLQFNAIVAPDSGKTYTSKWLGGRGGGESIFEMPGKQVVGIFGTSGLDLDSLGLIFAD